MSDYELLILYLNILILVATIVIPSCIYILTKKFYKNNKIHSIINEFVHLYYIIIYYCSTFDLIYTNDNNIPVADNREAVSNARKKACAQLELCILICLKNKNILDKDALYLLDNINKGCGELYYKRLGNLKGNVRYKTARTNTSETTFKEEFGQDIDNIKKMIDQLQKIISSKY